MRIYVNATKFKENLGGLSNLPPLPPPPPPPSAPDSSLLV